MLGVRWLVTAAMLAAAGFCFFGFVATFEPVANALFFRVVYAVIGAELFAAALFQAHKALHGL